MVQNKDIHLTSICFLGSDESIIEFNETLVEYLINARQKKQIEVKCISLF